MSNSTNNRPFDTVALDIKKVTAIQTTRFNPVSGKKGQPPYGGFNLGLHVGDDPDEVSQNRQHLLNELPEGAKIQWLEQVHGDNVVVVDSHHRDPIVADAVVTQQTNLALAVMTADCLPILLMSRTGDEVAAIHGGWKPLTKGIVGKTLDKMSNDAEQLIAWLGPCIGAQAFEVGNEVKEAFEKLDSNLDQCFTDVNHNKWLANLPMLATILLKKRGIKEIVSGHQCTVKHNERYYSYRKEQRTGRMATVIVKT